MKYRLNVKDQITVEGDEDRVHAILHRMAERALDEGKLHAAMDACEDRMTGCRLVAAAFDITITELSETES